MMASTVRVDSRTHKLLKQAADEEGISMQDALRMAVEAYRRQRVLVGTNHAYARLREKGETYGEPDLEMESLNSTLLDGLEEV